MKCWVHKGELVGVEKNISKEKFGALSLGDIRAQSHLVDGL